MNTNEETRLLVQRATAGDRAALEEVLAGVQDLVFNLSLRMLGTFPDAEDASQEILLRVMTHLSSFRGESAFSTWVFRIAANYLSGYRKHLFAQRPLSFEFYGEDIKNGTVEDLPDLSQDVSRELLAEELKLSCTNAPCSGWTAPPPGRCWASARRTTASASPGPGSGWRPFWRSTAASTATGNAAAPAGWITPSSAAASPPKGWTSPPPGRAAWCWR